MAESILDPEKKRVLRLQQAVVLKEQFFLAGGTGLGLRFGHRRSRDLDWFTARPFDVSELRQTLDNLPEKPTETTVGPYTLRAHYGQLETSFIRYTQVAARPELLSIGDLTIPVADIETLALMKAAAVHDRGTKRDFIDIHAICLAPGWSVGRFIDLATSRLPLTARQMKLALTYFADADHPQLPIRYGSPWNKVKRDLEQGVLQWERSRNRGLGR
jgi:hypothetical protein